MDGGQNPQSWRDMVYTLLSVTLSVLKRTSSQNFLSKY